jgi:hypothetical protein
MTQLVIKILQVFNLHYGNSWINGYIEACRRYVGALTLLIIYGTSHRLAIWGLEPRLNSLTSTFRSY